jgi:hypothetical protein
MRETVLRLDDCRARVVCKQPKRQDISEGPPGEAILPGSQRANVLETPPTHRAQVRPVHRTHLHAGGWQLWTRRYH